MKQILFLFSLLALSACSGVESRLVSFICEQYPNESEEGFVSMTLEDRQKDFDNAESNAAYHNEWVPWIFDKKTGDLYQYSDFEEALVPLIKSENEVNNGTVIWDEYKGILSSDGGKIKFKIRSMKKNALVGEIVTEETIHIYDIKKNVATIRVDTLEERTEKCMTISLDGIEVKPLQNAKTD